MKRAYFMTVIDSTFRMERACYKQTRYAFQPSCLTAVRLWALCSYNTSVSVVISGVVG